MIDEATLTKGQIRKLTALRKSVSNDIADKAFAEWMKKQISAGPIEKPDPVATVLLKAVKPTIHGLNLRRYGYTIRRSRAGLTATRNTPLMEQRGKACHAKP